MKKEKVLFMYSGCPHCGTQPVLLQKEQAEQILGKEIPYETILLCPKGCRYTDVKCW